MKELTAETAGKNAVRLALKKDFAVLLLFLTTQEHNIQHKIKTSNNEPKILKSLLCFYSFLTLGNHPKMKREFYFSKTRQTDNRRNKLSAFAFHYYQLYYRALLFPFPFSL